MGRRNRPNPLAGHGRDVLTGETRPVIAGEALFHLVDSRGLPFDLAVDLMAERGLAFDVVGFIRAARASGNYERPGRLRDLLTRDLTDPAAVAAVDYALENCDAR